MGSSVNRSMRVKFERSKVQAREFAIAETTKDYNTLYGSAKTELQHMLAAAMAATSPERRNSKRLARYFT
jgi:hypothetical protein